MKVFINPEFTALVDVLKLRFKNLEIFNPKEYERRNNYVAQRARQNEPATGSVTHAAICPDSNFCKSSIESCQE